uniref:EF-hand domain-containing protein n=1 Tax=Haptolina brevifila TaxID=156173 RepID=A0A7S2DPR1_9EUKA|mmetsp:Transcript_4202/g.9218  ORF Transcript_4202/g.9218 Transcript_4202/m.9218 type:complete len:205 (+) Transcript_4202:53-667(+)
MARRASACRIRFLAVCVVLSLAIGAHAYDAAAEKAVRMKTTRQLKEILKELKIKFDKDADKEELREVALETGAITKWEALHPEKQRTPRGMNPDGMPSTMNPDNMADMIFPMLDKNNDGRLSRDEMSTMGATDDFAQMDPDGDGFVTRQEAAMYFKMLSQTDTARTGGGGGAPGAGLQQRHEPQPPVSEAEDDEDAGLPSHDEL